MIRSYTVIDLWTSRIIPFGFPSIRIRTHIQAACPFEAGGRNALGPGCQSRTGFQAIAAWQVLRSTFPTGIGSIAP